MKRRRQFAESRAQRGVALLIAIFALLLISVVAIALLVSSGTDTALASNYRTSTSAYYTALAGLEEARGRLLSKNPDYINKTNSYPNLMDANGMPAWGLTQVLYITNPGPGETVDPTSGNPMNYPDTEYGKEFSWGLSGAAVQQIASVSGAGPLPGPNYKWVRINPITELSLNVDVNSDGVKDGAGVLYYDPAHVDASNNPASGLVVSAPSTPPIPPTPTAVEALEITALAVLPNGSQRILQYVVGSLIVSPQVFSSATSPSNVSFPAALTLAGSGVSYTSPGTSSFLVSGKDSCSGSNSLVYSMGYTNSPDGPGIIAEANPVANYTGYPPGAGGPPPPPSSGPLTIGNVDPNPINPVANLIRPSWTSVSGLESVIKDVTQNADFVYQGSALASSLPTGMSASHPLTIVVNGDLDFNGWHNTGYGLLLVTGTLKYDPDATWEGIVLVIGQGNVVSTRSGLGGIDGAVFIAKTRDASGTPLANLGPASFSQTPAGSNSGKGISYNSCWIVGSPGFPGARGPLTFKVLSFREIPLAN